MKRVDYLLVDLQFEAEYEFVTQSILNLTAYPQLLKIHLRGRLLKAFEEEPKDEEEAEETGDRDLFGYDYSVKLWDVKTKELDNLPSLLKNNLVKVYDEFYNDWLTTEQLSKLFSMKALTFGFFEPVFLLGIQSTKLRQNLSPLISGDSEEGKLLEFVALALDLSTDGCPIVIPNYEQISPACLTLIWALHAIHSSDQQMTEMIDQLELFEFVQYPFKKTNKVLEQAHLQLC